MKKKNGERDEPVEEAEVQSPTIDARFAPVIDVRQNDDLVALTIQIHLYPAAAAQVAGMLAYVAQLAAAFHSEGILRAPPGFDPKKGG